MKPHRRLPKVRRKVRHADGPSPTRLAWRIANQPRPPGAVTAGEVERDVLAFIAERYADRHLDIETVLLGLSNTAQRLTFLSLKSVA